VVPIIYCYLDDLSNWLRRRFGAGPMQTATVGADSAQ
jgi:hypothetical protein